ncbi:hypothetical protein [Neisseria wadsworthii]|uniref:Outer membrane protein n=1 Tax=Neisseria wadsworthii 9715 TaxID=1030841 RepID=G4CSZ3_9NEIS|nr:hypothetical protein [Neisseria wadsworthii]EGZ44490.1 outer membrane protein [Neisseria wadsworthii 9715]QMT35804.1 hypothetical protein H3L96_00555 [Neisseria wadsworthii]
MNRIRNYSLLLLGLAAWPAWADGMGAAEEDTWIDRQRGSVQSGIRGLAHNMDGWFGTPDPNRPASANLRVMLDTEWNKYDDFSVKPRVRGRVRLPVLEQRLNVIFGDDSLDDEPQQNAHVYSEQPRHSSKTFDRRQSRDDNASLALRWSDLTKRLGIETDFDLGVRSGNDIYARAKLGKEWVLNPKLDTRVEQIYRYGLDSKHHARTNWEIRHGEENKPFIANQLHVQYEHDHEELWTWGNSLYRQHDLEGMRRLNYGIYTGGDIKNRKAKLNSYGPFAGWRQPVWKDWLFMQTEVNYLNDKKQDRSHHVGALLRFEALF